MHLQGNVSINAPRAQVWEYLTDPNKVSQCAPGVESVELVEPERAKMKAHGTAPGSAADVVSEMTLSDLPGGGTQMHWTADISIVGQLAGLAARLMGTVSQKL